MTTTDAPIDRPTSAAVDSDAELEARIEATRAWLDQPRFRGIERLHTARDVVEQQGTIATDHTVARDAASGFFDHLRDLFARREQITTFGPYSPGQAVALKRMGIDAIYLGGWATSAKGSVTEDPGPDLASYPLSQVPDEAATLVRALLTADRNQHFARARMSAEQRRDTPEVDYRPFIIADADTGHGGDAHVRNLQAALHPIKPQFVAFANAILQPLRFQLDVRRVHDENLVFVVVTAEHALHFINVTHERFAIRQQLLQWHRLRFKNEPRADHERFVPDGLAWRRFGHRVNRFRPCGLCPAH
jgi:hypothetical protein